MEAGMPPDAMSYPDPQGSDGVDYPVTDHMGETGFQQWLIWSLTEPLRDYFASRGRDVLIGGDQFFYWVKGDASFVLAPDVYLIDDETMTLRDVDCWKVWEHGGKAPGLAIEFVSQKTHKKDYKPEQTLRYEGLGVRELVRYDPDHVGRRGRALLTHWVRDANGRLVEQDHPPDRVHSVHYDFWLVVQPDQSLRMSLDGVTPWPSRAERLEAENVRVEAENAALRAELARLRGG